MPEAIKKLFVAKSGYVNYYFNQQNQDRVWRDFTSRGNFATAGGVWNLTGEVMGGGDVELEISDERARVKLPGGEVKVDLTQGDLSQSLDPPGSGGMLVALGLWRRLLVGGPSKFGQVYYLGTEPLYSSEGKSLGLCDILVGIHGGVECHFLFEPTSGHLAAVEMYPDDDVDACEILLSDYREVEGRQAPHHVEIRRPDGIYQVYQIKSYTLAPSAEK